ncbi:TetR family transcriptional regulator [Amycolatopsis mediterranei S699]|uniref:TetR family transcriptional regulator n=2 Tax=Amycolatopsis mediterranei TaxID=33910 RepID=A0A0H3D5H7_AMYMU|nr:TetR/AcrR family transcriptional regulator [Amycolatopsis mediterranei]ADJ45532.1 TetR family transcriptional regulator [Amycolatopsis mediterranei U32]AEK42308.1 TetR family transcriptional regulator [Amycolatopsis mediterranei S699]AFO77244.1 TetR family transcriptional regulator [Amycolatopsis mediterranei S699]AGT84372.1 TetR family transcriptional regulator [Amycolatopsis mediterranei RB]KDO05790.1 TetR family transcriptional regulator [Amycolatopsis mediterranei]
MITGTGRRERKKAATHQALADAALRLFLERGYDNVGVREIADAADVSTTTLQKHFPSKESLVFDRDAEIEDALLAAVRDRAPGTSVLDALRDHTLARVERGAAADGASEFMTLVRSTPALSEYWHRMWMRHEEALTRVLAAETGAPETDPGCAALAHFALETSALAIRSENPARVAEAAFAILEHGWRTSSR